MNRKLVKIDGKSYLLDLDTKQLEEVTVDEEETVETPNPEVTPEVTPKPEVKPAETPAPETTDDVEKKIQEATNEVVSKLGLGQLNETLKEIKAQLGSAETITGNKRASDLLDLEALVGKSKSEMTAKEKIVGFFQAALQNNKVALKALAEGVAADGGYLFPDEFRYEIIRDLEEGSYMRNYVKIIPMKRDVMKIPSLASRPKVTWTEENTTKSTTTAHYGQETLTVKKMAAILYASDELIDDASNEYDIVQHIVSLFAESLGQEEDRVIWRGNGTTQPTGIVTARVATTIASTACAGNLSFDDIINLLHLLPQKYHRNAKFYVNRTNIRELRKLKDSNNRYYWQEPVAAGQPPTLYGYPVIEVNDLPESELYFGDLKQAYWLGDRQRMTVKVTQDSETAFTKDQTAIRVVQRIAGNVVLGAAVRALTNIP